MEDSLWQDVWPQSPGGSGFLLSILCDFLCCVSISFSPAWSQVLSHLAPSLRGLWTIRAYKAEQRFQEVFDTCQDLHSGLYISGNDFKRWDVLPSEAWPPSQVVLLASPSLCVPPCPFLHTCLPYPFPSASPLCSLLSLSHPCFSPLTALHCPCITVS